MDGKGTPSWLLLALACAVALVPPLARAEDFYTGTDVVELTASNFKSKVLDDEHVWMVEFYAPWCGHCQKLKPDYIKAATASKGIVRFGAINCDDHRSLASQYGIKGFPTLKLFGPNKKRYEDYNGARSPKAMADAALALLPNHVTVVTGKSHDDWLQKNSDLPKALLFTAKATTTALYKALALDLKGRMALGEVRAKKDSALLSQYDVEESALPVLLVLPAPGKGEEGSRPRYDGELKHKPLLKFLLQYAKAKGDKDGKEASEKATKPKATPSPARAVQQLLSPKDVEAHCLKAKGFCVVALLRGADPDSTTEHISKLEVLEAKYHKDPLHFSWADVSKTPALESHFLEEGGSPGPALVLLSPKRSKFTVHWGFDGLESLLDRAIGGDVTLESKLDDDWHKALASA